MKILLKMVRRMVVALLALAGAMLTLAAVITALRIPLSLSFAVAGIEAGTTQALGRQVVIDGPIRTTPGLWPVVKIGGLQITNSPG